MKGGVEKPAPFLFGYFGIQLDFENRNTREFSLFKQFLWILTFLVKKCILTSLVH